MAPCVHIHAHVRVVFGGQKDKSSFSFSFFPKKSPRGETPTQSYNVYSYTLTHSLTYLYTFVVVVVKTQIRNSRSVGSLGVASFHKAANQPTSQTGWLTDWLTSSTTRALHQFKDACAVLLIHLQSGAQRHALLFYSQSPKYPYEVRIFTPRSVPRRSSVDRAGAQYFFPFLSHMLLLPSLAWIHLWTRQEILGLLNWVTVIFSWEAYKERKESFLSLCFLFPSFQ